MKKIISAIVVLTIIFSLAAAPVSAAAIAPVMNPNGTTHSITSFLKGLDYFQLCHRDVSNPTDSNTNIEINNDKEALEVIRNARCVAFKVNFNDCTDPIIALKMDFDTRNTWSSGSVVTIKTANTPGWSGSTVATISGSYVNNDYVLLTNPIQPTTEDFFILVCVEGDYKTLKSIQLSTSYQRFTDTVIVSDGTNVMAGATLLNNSPTGMNCNLVLGKFDSSFKPAEAFAVDRKTNVAGIYPYDFMKSISYSADANYFAVMLDDEFNPITKAVFYNAPDIAMSEVTTELPVEAIADGTVVKIEGCVSDESTSVLLGVRLQSDIAGNTANIAVNEYSKYEMIYQVPVTDGKYSFSYVAKDGSITGTYCVNIRTDKGTVASAEFNYVSPNDIIDAFNDINGAAGGDTALGESIGANIDTAINNWMLNIGLDLTYINSSEKRTWIYDYIFANRPETGFTGVIELQKAIDEATFLEKINLYNDDETNVQAYKNLTGITNDNYYKEYYAETDKSVLYDKLNSIIDTEYNGFVSSIEEFIGAFREALVLTALSYQVAWGSVDELVSAFKDTLEKSDSTTISATINEYLILSNEARQSICVELLDKDFSSVDGFVQLFESQYKAVVSDKDTEQGSIIVQPPVSGGGFVGGGIAGGSFVGGAASGGGGGGGSTATTAPTVSDEPKENTESTPEVEPEITKPKVEFVDLEGYEWAEDAIKFLATEGVVDGKRANEYVPAEMVTREEFVKLLVLAFGAENTNAKCDFDDVTADKWYYPYVSTAYNRGWVSGYSESEFGVGRNITREEMAVMFYRAIVDVNGPVENINSSVFFSDFEQISDYAQDAVIALSKAGIMNGVGFGLFDPASSATRAECAVLIYKYLSL